MICGNEKGDLQKQGKRTAEGVDRFIMVFPIIGLDHHKPLIPMECLIDMGDPFIHSLLDVSLFFLEFIRLFVHGHDHEIHHQAYRDDRYSGILNRPVGNTENSLQDQFNGIND